MTVLSWVAGPVAVAFIVVGFGMLGQAAVRVYRLMRLGQPDPTRAAPVGARLKVLATEVLGHTRMLKWGFIGVAHWFVMVGFGALVLTLVEAVGETFNPRFELPWLGHQAWYGLFVELIALTTVLGIGTLIVVRQISRRRTRSRFEGSNSGQAYFVEAVILSIGFCIFGIRAFKWSTGNLPYPRWAAPISAAIGDVLPAWLWAITVIALIKVIVSMVWAIVIARNLKMGVAWHRFLAFVNIYFKRSGSALSPGGTALGALKPMMSGGAPVDFEKADPETDLFGVGKVEDFSWKGWLDFSTCTECGRCQSQCPAWNTAKALSPKLLVLSLRDHAHAKAPYLAAGGAGMSDEAKARLAHENPLALLEAQRPLVGSAEANGVIDPAILWDCTTCGACVDQCPVDIEHVDHIVDMRRNLVMIESEFPAELAGLFRNLENKGNPWGSAQRDRLEWAKGLEFDIPVVTDQLQPDHEYLFWVGCAGAFDDRARKTTRAVAELLYMAAVGFAVLGQGESCTGDPARRAGNEFLFQTLAQQNVETINAAFGERAQRKVVVTCAHCFNTLANEYPSLGGDYEVVHHTQLLNRLVAEKRLTRKPVPPTRTATRVTYHDPCYIGRHNQIYNPPRELIEASGAELEEMPRNAARAMCCGAGGARMWMEEKSGKRINLERTDEALATGAEKIVTGCPFCKVMLSDGLTARQGESQGEGVEVLDVAQMLLAGVKGSESA